MMLYCMLLLLIKNAYMVKVNAGCRRAVVPDLRCWCGDATGGHDSSCGVGVHTRLRCRGGDVKFSRCFVLFPLRLKNELKILIVIS